MSIAAKLALFDESKIERPDQAISSRAAAFVYKHDTVNPFQRYLMTAFVRR